MRIYFPDERKTVPDRDRRSWAVPLEETAGIPTFTLY